MDAQIIENKNRKKIFLSLCKAEKLKYSELKPNGMESNHFAYHLKKMIEDGFIEKSNDSRYTLAPKGLRIAEKISFKLEDVREQPKSIVVVQVYSKNGKKVLVGKRKKQPHIDKFVIPGGKVHFGEDQISAAKRTIKEFLPNFSSESESELEFKGNFRIRYFAGKSCYSHISGTAFYVKLKSVNEEEINMSEVSTNSFEWIDRKSNIEFKDWVKGSKELIEAIEGNNLFNLELVYEE